MTQAGAHALVVDDDRSWQQILKEILTDAGLTVDIADSLESAVEHLRAIPHRLAVIDLALAGGDHTNEDGLRVLDAVRLHDPGCITVLLTGYATVELAVSALTEHGAFTCLRKATFRRSEFREVVNRALVTAPVETLARPDFSDQAQAESGPQAMATTKEPDVEASDSLALLVEDDASWRNILSELLVVAGYQVRSCGSYGEALAYLRREKFGLAVLDLSLSLSSGRDVPLDGYRLLSSTQSAGIPTVVVSGLVSPEDVERAYRELGVFACLEKQTFDRRAFLRLVSEAQQTGQGSHVLDGLTDREREVLELLVQGLTNKDIAEALFITHNTVKRHLKAIFEKLGVHTRAAAVAFAIHAGIPAQPRQVDVSEE